MILRDKLQYNKDYSVYEHSSNQRRDENNLRESERIDPKSVLGGEFGQEIIKIN